MKPRIETDLPFADYTELPHVNQSSFADIDPDRGGCPAIWFERHYRNCRPGGDAEDDTEAKDFGRAFHAFALTPALFARQYVVEDQRLYDAVLEKAATDNAGAKEEVRRRKADGQLIKDMPAELVRHYRAAPPKEFSKSLGAWAAYKADIAAVGKSLLSPKRAEQISAMWASAMRQPRVVALFDNADAAELTAVAELDDGTGRKVGCKARLDLVTGREINDLKTIISAAPADLGRFIWRHRCHVQAAFYLDIARAAGIAAEWFSWTFVDKRAPHPTTYHRAEPELIKLGRAGYQSYLQLIADCRESGDWPGHHDCPIYPDILETLMAEV